MKKAKAIELLGGTPAAAAAALGITVQAVSQWEDDLSQRSEDRVLAFLAKKHLSPDLLGAAPAADESAAQAAA